MAAFGQGLRKGLRYAAWALLALALGSFLTFRHLARRALPELDGTRTVAGIRQPVEIVRDRWGVPHIFAGSDEDAYFALGYVHAQDRLFQLDLTRHVSQGRLAELVGEPGLDLDLLFRTIDLHGPTRRMLERASAPVRAAARAYALGINTAVADLDGALPLEFTLLSHEFERAEHDDFVGVIGLMTWGLNLSWEMDRRFEQLAARLGEERARELFPFIQGGSPAVHPRPGTTATKSPAPETAQAVVLLDRLGELISGASSFPFPSRFLPMLNGSGASNSWVVSPRRSTTGHAILANDPHLGFTLPPIWYQAHLHAPGFDVAGVTLPGLPLVVIGRNRDIAWGLTNVMQDAADFFVEKLDPERPGRVMHRGAWVELKKRVEKIRIKGGGFRLLEVLSTPHGPLVNHLLPEIQEPVSYRWTLQAADHANEAEGLWLLNRARNWEEFRRSMSLFGAAAQNVIYADREGHIGMQTVGAFPRLAGRNDGLRFRVGWDGSEEWDGFHPFEENPVSFDPPQGWLASANNPTVEAPGPFYISAYWEPVDRISRIREVLASREKLSVEDMEGLQGDLLLMSAREIVPLLLEAFDSSPAAAVPVRKALELMRGWNHTMEAGQAAPTLFAVFHRQLFEEIFQDELGEELIQAFRSRGNLPDIMVRTVLKRGAGRWLDRAETPRVEELPDILRAAFRKAVDRVSTRWGPEPKNWVWGEVHTLTLPHPVGATSWLLGGYFNLGPFPVPGSNGTVRKMEYRSDDFRVVSGASVRQISDFSKPDRILSALPGGQSGIPASSHYDDLPDLWLAGQYHTIPMNREAIQEAHRLVLRPEAAAPGE